METKQFQNFIDFFDQKTQGKYTYYYRRLWDGYQQTSDSYNNVGGSWLVHFKNYMQDSEMPQQVQQQVKISFEDWQSNNK